MALAPVTIPEWLRPWHSAGVWQLLADEPVAARGRAAPVSPASAARSGVNRAAPLGNIPQGSTAAPSAPVGPSPRQAARPHSEKTERKGTATPETAAHPISPPSDVLSVRSEEAGDTQTWPEPWQRLLAKSVPSPVLWTYHELGLDLTGSGQAARGALFRRLLADLRLPKGSSVFWPTALPTEAGEGGALIAEPALFWTGVARLQARIVVVFGSDGLRDMGLEASNFPVYQQRIVNGKWVAAMPGINQLLADESRLMPTLSFLQAVLTPFIPA